MKVAQDYLRKCEGLNVYIGTDPPEPIMRGFK